MASLARARINMRPFGAAHDPNHTFEERSVS
jgi:hypothetical protein